MRDGWMKALGSAGLTCEELMVEVQGSSTEKECLGSTTDKMSKGISLPKQRAQSCQAACQRDRARWDGSLSLPPPPRPVPSPPPLRCFGDKTEPDLCQQLGKASLAVLCESDKNNATRASRCRVTPSTGLFFLAGGVTVGQSRVSKPADIKAALSYAPFSPLSFPVLTGNRR